MWVLANTHQCSPLLAVLVFAEKGKKCAQKSDARKMLSCPHNVCNAYEMLAWCDRCMVYPVIYMNVNLVTFNESAHAASTLQAPSPLYAHYEHPVSIMRRCCEYAASTITVIRTLWASCKHHVQMLRVRCKHHHPYTHVKHFWQIDVHYFNLWNTSNWKIHLLTFYLLNIYSFEFTTTVNFQIEGSYFLCFWELFC